MNCPYCEKEMFRGFIDNGRALNWLPEGERARPIKSRYAVSLTTEYDLDSGGKTVAFYCYDCQKVLINVVPGDVVKAEKARLIKEDNEKLAELKRSGGQVKL